MAFVFSVLIHNNPNIFKRRLDAHWQDQDIMGLYDFCAHLIYKESEVVVKYLDMNNSFYTT